ncbi:hypothetical protein ES702_00377 [subsurface metagenome]
MPSFRVIILSAGVGERLRPLTYTTHKNLLEINGKAVIQHLLDALIYSGADVDMVHIVVGHYAYKFRKLLGKQYKTLNIQLLKNQLFKITGGAQSLYAAYHILSKHPCLVVDGDHYMDPELMRLLMNCKFENAILVDDPEKSFDGEETLAYGNEGIVTKLKWMPPYPPNPLGEALTIFKLSKEASHALAVILEDYLLEDGPAKREHIEPFNRLMRLHDIHQVSTEGKNWLEIDYEKDYEKAKVLKFET